MRKISKKNREEIDNNEYYRCCARADHNCEGRITIEHVFIYAGKQIDEIWSLIPLCAKHHGVDLWQDGGLLDKEINKWIAINRATESDFKKYPRFDWEKEKSYLNKKYGVPNLSTGKAPF